MDNVAVEARRKYMKEYREKNAEHIKEYQREYQRNYRKSEQGKASICRYWAKKAKEMGLVEGE